MKTLLTLGLAFSLFNSSVFASDTTEIKDNSSLDYAQVEYVEAVQSSDGTWCFYTTIRHNDQGWDHYADGWIVTDLKGNELGERLLAHPHVDEQPFTRSQCNIHIPKDLSKVIVRARCNQHGFAGQAIILDLTALQGTGFSMRRNQE